MARSKNRRRKDAKRKRKTRSTRPTPGSATGQTAGRPARPASGPATRPTGAAKTAEGPPGRLIPPWWERWPGRLKWELEQLEAKGLRPEVDERSRRKGRLVVRVTICARGNEHELVVVFPDFYPELRFEVYATTLDLPRHQNPFDRNLCLLDRDTEQWRPTDSAAALITERVPKLLELLGDAAALRDSEVPQGEPTTDYYRYEPGSVVFIPGFALGLSKNHQAGFIHLRPESGANGACLRGLLFQATDESGRILGQANADVARTFAKEGLVGRWVRLHEPPRTADGPQMIQFLLQKYPELRKARWKKLQGRKLDIVGLVFPEEVAHETSEDAWLLLVRQQTGATYLSRGQRVAEEDFLARVPELAPLRGCTVGVAGLGALGAPSALEFARCQVGELRVLDPDIVEAGNLVRWPLGLAAAGRQKVEVLFKFIDRNYPLTRLKGYSLRIGTATLGEQSRTERELLSEFLDGLDLIYDATAQPGVQYLISNLARESNLPQLYVGSTEGAWGGMVTRCIPGETGCWYCWKLHLDQGTLPLPSFQPGGPIQPRGCATRTFTGSGFDQLPVVAQGIRMAVQTLVNRSGGARTFYPRSGGDVSVLYLRDGNGSPSGCPRWEHHKLEIHPRCPFCVKS